MILYSLIRYDCRKSSSVTSNQFCCRNSLAKLIPYPAFGHLMIIDKLFCCFFNKTVKLMTYEMKLEAGNFRISENPMNIFLKNTAAYAKVFNYLRNLLRVVF